MHASWRVGLIVNSQRICRKRSLGSKLIKIQDILIRDIFGTWCVWWWCALCWIARIVELCDLYLGCTAGLIQLINNKLYIIIYPNQMYSHSWYVYRKLDVSSSVYLIEKLFLQMILWKQGYSMYFKKNKPQGL